MTDREPPTSPVADRLRDGFARQPLLNSLGAALNRAEAGECDIRVPWTTRLCADGGGVHPGVSAALAETAALLAVSSRLPAGASLLTLEQTLQLGAPARGNHLLAVARVERDGPTLLVVRAEVLAETGAVRRTVAVLTATLMAVRNGGEAPFTGHWRLDEPRGAKAARAA